LKPHFAPLVLLRRVKTNMRKSMGWEALTPTSIAAVLVSIFINVFRKFKILK